MSTPTADITIPNLANSLKLGTNNRQGELTFTVKNVLPRSLSAAVELVFAEGTVKPAWLTVPSTIEFDVNETVPIKVTANLGGGAAGASPAPTGPGAPPAPLPAGVKAGKYTFKLRVSDKNLGNDFSSESQPVTIEVEDRRVVTPMPKWLLPVILGGVAL